MLCPGDGLRPHSGQRPCRRAGCVRRNRCFWKTACAHAGYSSAGRGIQYREDPSGLCHSRGRGIQALAHRQYRRLCTKVPCRRRFPRLPDSGGPKREYCFQPFVWQNRTPRRPTGRRPHGLRPSVGFQGRRHPSGHYESL